MRIRFGPFTLVPVNRQLSDGAREIPLSSKGFDLLTTLALKSPNVLSKAELQQTLWPDTFVAEANLSNLVAELRQALGDSRRRPLFIRTVHGFGYAFCAQTAIIRSGSPSDADRSTCWLEWGQRRFPLSAGSHVVGRDPDVEVTLDASTVSRRHARLVVSDSGTILEDFGSKNGTYRGDERVIAPVALADGDAIRIGSVLVTFHVRVQDATETLVASP